MNLKSRFRSRQSDVRLRCAGLEERVTPATFNIGDGDVAALVAAINTANSNCGWRARGHGGPNWRWAG